MFKTVTWESGQTSETLAYIKAANGWSEQIQIHVVEYAVTFHLQSAASFKRQLLMYK